MTDCKQLVCLAASLYYLHTMKMCKTTSKGKVKPKNVVAVRVNSFMLINLHLVIHNDFRKLANFLNQISH